MSGHKEKHRIAFATGGVEGGSLTVGVPSGFKTVAELMPVFHALFDQIIASEVNGLAITCGPGCATCCRQLIPISLPFSGG
ncbi:MAG: hypothetical protein GY850_44040 [bacterium]|nr:hypothetical protein [bacterium]